MQFSEPFARACDLPGTHDQQGDDEARGDAQEADRDDVRDLIGMLPELGLFGAHPQRQAQADPEPESFLDVIGNHVAASVLAAAGQALSRISHKTATVFGLMLSFPALAHAFLTAILQQMTYTLYYSPGAASLAVHWMLLELGVPFEAKRVDLDAGAQRSAEYLRLNPAGRVPTLVIDGVAHGESTALLMLLAERHPEKKFAPEAGAPTRADWLETMIYLANTVLPAMRDWFYADKDGDPQGAEAVKALARRRIEGAWDRLDARLADGRVHLLGSELSTVDFLGTMLMRWSRNMPRPATTWKNLAPYIQRMRSRPSFVEVNDREGLTDWRNS